MASPNDNVQILVMDALEVDSSRITNPTDKALRCQQLYGIPRTGNKCALNAQEFCKEISLGMTTCSLNVFT